MLVEIGQPAVPNLLAALENKDSSERERIALILARIDTSPKMVKVFTDFIEDKTPRDAADRVKLKTACIRGLAQIGPEAKAAVPLLVGILKDPKEHRDLRSEAAKALGEIGAGDKRVTEALVKAVKEPGVNSAACRGLTLLGPPAIPVLLGLFQNKDNWDGDRGGVLSVSARSSLAADALGDMGKQAVPALLEALKDTDKVKRLSVIQALGRIGPPAKNAVPALLELIKLSNVSLEAGIALQRIDPEAAKNAGVK
jgi:HEAT repeat protein